MTVPLKFTMMPEVLPEVLSFEEMQRRYRDEWLLIAYTELDENLNVVQGQVLAHSPHRDRVYDALASRQGKAVAIEYVGELPEDWAVML